MKSNFRLDEGKTSRTTSDIQRRTFREIFFMKGAFTHAFSLRFVQFHPSLASELTR